MQHKSFVHRIDGVIAINDTEVPLAALLAYDPSYTLPTGIRSVRYTVDSKTGSGYHFQHNGIRNLRAEHPCPQLDRYIQNLQGIQEIAKSIADESKEIDSILESVTKSYADKRKQEYPKIDELVVALWEMLIEGKDTNAVQDIQSRRLNTKRKYPKS